MFFDSVVKNFWAAIRQRLVDLTTSADRWAIEPTHGFTRAAAVGNGDSSPQNERLGAHRQLGALRTHKLVEIKELSKCWRKWICGYNSQWKCYGSPKRSRQPPAGAFGGLPSLEPAGCEEATRR